MAVKKTRPVIGKLLTTGNYSGATEPAGTSPRSPFDLKILSPRGIINRDVSGVGLGIVAALQKSGDGSRCQNQIPVNQADFDDDEEEEYTIVTRHMPNNSYTKVYDGGFVYEGYVTKKGMKIGGGESLFDISPAPAPAPARIDIKVGDFLSCCHQCNKELHGKDIYMYRGEKGFCSIECRCREIMMEESREKRCSSEAAAAAVSSSTCGYGQMSSGIFAI